MYLKLIGKGIVQMCLGALSLVMITKMRSTGEGIYFILSLLPLAAGIIMQMRLIEKLKVIVAESIIRDLNRA